jgi:hypothetical protein
MAFRTLSWPAWPSIAITGARGSDGNIIADVSRAGGTPGGGVEYIMGGVGFVSHPTQQ